MVRRSAPPPPHGPWSRMHPLPPVGGVWGPSSSVAWSWGFGVLGFSLSF